MLLLWSLKKNPLHFLCLCSSGCALHGDLCVCAASRAVALQRFSAAAADAQPEETDGGRVRPLPATARLWGDGALAGTQPSVQILCECKLHIIYLDIWHLHQGFEMNYTPERSLIYHFLSVFFLLFLCRWCKVSLLIMMLNTNTMIKAFFQIKHLTVTVQYRAK